VHQRPATALLDSQSVASGPQAGPRGVDGNKKVRGIKRHVLTCSLGFVLATLVTAANVHDTQPVGALLDRAAQDGWAVQRVKADGIYVGPRMAQAAQDHDVDVQVTTRERDEKGFKPLPLRWRVEATFGTLANRWHRLTRRRCQVGSLCRIMAAFRLWHMLPIRIAASATGPR